MPAPYPRREYQSMSDTITDFSSFDLPTEVLCALQELGYESPSPIQAECIPLIKEGRDVLGMAQTGTGKTAAFALPLISRIDVTRQQPQVLVLAPTRELAIQVAEAFQAYARFIPEFHVLPLYGGQNYGLQLKQLRRGPQVIVGTPGRVLDHLNRKSLDLSGLNCMVLDEADEMLRMGFIDDVEAIMSATPEQRQTALFSATMPERIRTITKRYMRQPVEVKIAAKTSTVERISQRFLLASPANKLEALTRVLEVEDFDGLIIFARTKTATVELAEKLEARGYASAPLNGDMNQALRERTVDRLKEGKLDILVATDVAARGLDVSRISHVLNYDIPYDTEAYVHRIGRTGRAGREGTAILFVTPRERYMLKQIEKATKQQIAPMTLPSSDEIAQKRVESFKGRLVEILSEESLDYFNELVPQLTHDLELSLEQLAGALLFMAQKDKPLEPPEELPQMSLEKERKPRREGRQESEGPRERKGRRSDTEMDLFRIEVGLKDGVQTKHIVGAIANEGDISSKYIGVIKLYDDHSTVELPSGMPDEMLKHFQRTFIVKKPMKMKRISSGEAPQQKAPRKRKPR